MLPSPDAARILEVAANAQEVRRLALFLREACATAGVDEAATIDCELALVEAANNVVEHGYANRGDGTMALQVTVEGAEVRLVLTDRGESVPKNFFNRCRLAQLDAEGGRGSTIIQSCIDEIIYSSRKGINSLTMIKRF